MRNTPAQALERQLAAVGSGFLIPLFFVTSGTELDLFHFISSPASLLRLILFLLGFLLVRAAPVFLYRNALPQKDLTPLGLLSATTLSLVIAITYLGTRTDICLLRTPRRSWARLFSRSPSSPPSLSGCAQPEDEAGSRPYARALRVRRPARRAIWADRGAGRAEQNSQALTPRAGPVLENAEWEPIYVSCRLRACTPENGDLKMNKRLAIALTAAALLLLQLPRAAFAAHEDEHGGWKSGRGQKRVPRRPRRRDEGRTEAYAGAGKELAAGRSRHARTFESKSGSEGGMA